jgi:hypothetical protein
MRRLVLICCLVLAPLTASADGLRAYCARVGDDDTIRSYDPALRSELAAAFQRLFSGAPAPDRRMLRVQTHLRCMGGYVLACFTGANLPCSKLNTAQTNPGADNYCRSNPETDNVPAFATGHDTAFTFRCHAGKSQVSGKNFPLDSRGFAASLWTPVD